MRRQRGTVCRAIAGGILLTCAITATMNAPTSAASPSIGWLDSISVSTGDAIGSITLSGWTLTSDYPSAGLGVYAFIDGQRSLVGYRIADEYRPDVGAAYPGYGDWHGFVFTVPAPSGTHNVCIQALNTVYLTTLSGCQNYTMPSFASGALRRFTGGHFLQNEPNPISLSWTRTTADYAAEIDITINLWEANTTKVSFAWTSSPSAQIRITAKTNAGAYIGLGESYPCPGASSSGLYNNVVLGCQYGYGQVTLNRSQMPGPGTYRQKVITHEVGHVLGLFHPPNTAFSVMRGGDPGSGGGIAATPSAWDADGLNQILYK